MAQKAKANRTLEWFGGEVSRIKTPCMAVSKK